MYNMYLHLCLWWPSGVPGKQAPQGEIVTPAFAGGEIPWPCNLVHRTFLASNTFFCGQMHFVFIFCSPGFHWVF